MHLCLLDVFKNRFHRDVRVSEIQTNVLDQSSTCIQLLSVPFITAGGPSFVLHLLTITITLLLAMIKLLARWPKSIFTINQSSSGFCSIEEGFRKTLRRNKMIELKAKPEFMTKRLEYFYESMKNEKHVDMPISVNGRNFYSHMIVLTACSQFFDSDETSLNEALSGFDFPVIEAMLSYCYLGEILIDDKHFEKFMELAKKLNMNSIDPRHKFIDHTNCLEVLRLSDDPISRMIQGKGDLHITPSFLSLPATILAEILASEEINVDSEEDDFNSLKLWVNSDEVNRRSELLNLLSLVKFLLLSIQFLVMKSIDFCSLYPECNAIIKQAIKSILPNYQCLEQNESLRGRIDKDGNSKSTNEVQVYSVECNTWSYNAPMIQGRENHSSITITGRLYVAGGYNAETQSFLDSIESFDPDSNLWTAYCRLPYLASAISLCFYRNKFICMGGHNGKTSLSNVWEYNTTSKTWKSLKSLSKIRYCAVAHVIPYYSIV
ncbi:kelch-like protein 25 [Arctopsyche grandis]|uniref:kelch-like protein 25 n=1 Tax=Arctopsyche grandis TaxID=121162 RepID=UPI00406D9391